MGEKTRIAVCVITCQRPDGLKRLIYGLNELTFESCAAPELQIVVVDNDPAGSACEFLEGIRPDLRWPLKCAVEPRRGIPFARNKAVATAGENLDFVASLDDDEVPEPLWLDELLYAQRLYEADVVGGPVIPYFDEPVPSWVVRGKFFDRPRHATGTLLKVAATNNALIRAEIFKSMDEHFSTRLGMTGADDTHFFMRVHRAGYRMVWADDARVHEWIPGSRANAKWLLRRAYGLGTRITLCELDIDPSFSTRARRVAKASGRIVQGISLIPLSPFLGGRRALYGALQYVSRGTGIFAGLAGKGYQEYREIHGT
jgi:succinoglycan biosynthesis protein ExoM